MKLINKIVKDLWPDLIIVGLTGYVLSQIIKAFI